MNIGRRLSVLLMFAASACGSGGSGSGGTGGGTGGNATGGSAATGGAATGGATTGGHGGAGGVHTGGSSGSGGGAGSAGSSGLPWLTVSGNKLQDPAGKTIVLRGSALIDIGSLYWYGGQSAAGITARIDKVAAAGVQGHVVRLPVYPKINYNTGGSPDCSPCPYPVGTGITASCTPKSPLTAADYVANVLKPAVDYATSKNLYVIIDYHQIDNATSGTSAADAKTFWTDIAPKFAAASNVLYEPFNEPIDANVPWSTLKPVVQQLIDTIRAAAPKNLIIVPSNIWDQRPGDAASDPPSGTNLMYTAHIYPANWNTTFQSQVATATAKVPVFITEWGYDSSDPASFGTSLQTTVNGDGASWTAWVTDNAWTPSIFADANLTTLTGFGMLVKSWLAATANSDWVQ
jgi:endoglucanase